MEVEEGDDRGVHAVRSLLGRIVTGAFDLGMGHLTSDLRERLRDAGAYAELPAQG